MAASTSTSLPPLQRSIDYPLNTPPSLLSQFTSPLPSRLYSRQYAALYDYRLRALRRGRLLAKARAKWEEAQDAEGEEKPRWTEKILDIKKGKVTYITGIVYREMKLKPDVLQDLTREQYLPPLPPVESYCDPASDSIYLEDESGRLLLVGPIFSDPEHRGSWITGTVGAFLGTERENGEFHVQQVCWPGLPQEKKATSQQTSHSSKKIKLDGAADGQENDQYAVLLSGLDLGAADTLEASDGEASLGYAQGEMRLGMLTEWISGEIGDEATRNLASRIAGIVIAGNLMAVQKADGSLFNAAEGTTTSNGGDASIASKGSSSSKTKQTAASRADAALAPPVPAVLLSHLVPLSASIPIVLMPGATDPASAALPQQAVHRAILQGASRWNGSSTAEDKVKKEASAGSANTNRQAVGGIELYNNPSWVQFGQVKILATSGQNLDDIMKYIPPSIVSEDDPDLASTQSDLPETSQASAGRQIDAANGQGSSDIAPEVEDRLNAACRLLDFGHIAPTAPDTLWCFPFTDRDPFIINTIPDVLVIGNQPAFASTLYDTSDTSSEGASMNGSDPSSMTRVVLLPRFSLTGEIALMNLRTREIKRIKLGWQM